MNKRYCVLLIILLVISSLSYYSCGNSKRDKEPVLLADREAPLGWEEAPELAEIIARGISCRESESQITCFINNMGLGVQFAALGAVIYEQARELGLGQEIPLNWFTQNVHP